jgi:alpha-tubulin suppressor-like RCC1 family protein
MWLPMPKDVPGLSGVVAIASGDGFSCALTSGGGVKCWGGNKHGELGNGTTTDSDSPVDVQGLGSGVAALAKLGASHACALMANAGVKCWGWNSIGQLGDGTTTDRSVPVDVVGLGGPVAAVAASGEWSTCALLVGGGVQCWGYNVVGQLGNGSLSSSAVPVNVVGLGSGVAAISVGDGHACALMTGNGGMCGSIKCWGQNETGELGDGTFDTTAPFGSLVPVDVVGL